MPEQIVKIKKNVPGLNGKGVVSATASHECEIKVNTNMHGHPDRPQFEAALVNNTFQIYTISEIDNIAQDIERKVSEITEQRITVVETRLETGLKVQVSQLIDNIPQKLLIEETVKIIKEAVLLELKQELDSMKRDFQAQIDALTP